MHTCTHAHTHTHTHTHTHRGFQCAIPQPVFDCLRQLWGIRYGTHKDTLSHTFSLTHTQGHTVLTKTHSHTHILTNSHTRMHVPGVGQPVKTLSLCLSLTHSHSKLTYPPVLSLCPQPLSPPPLPPHPLTRCEGFASPLNSRLGANRYCSGMPTYSRSRFVLSRSVFASATG